MADKKLRVEDKLTEEQKIIKKISDFTDKNKKFVLYGVIAFVAVLLIVLVVTVISTSSSEKSLVRVSSYGDQLAEQDVNVDELITNLEKEVKGSSYASVKAQYLIGIAYAQKNDLATAYDAFIKASKMNSKIYLSNLALLNAAVCKDNLGDTATAIDLYNQVIGLDDDYGLAPRALFNIGRIYYLEGNYDLAKATFQNIIDDYVNSEYARIAKNVVSGM